MFPICWNILVFHAALTGLVIVGFIKLGQPDLYTPIHGDILSKEVDKLSGKDLMNYQSDLYHLEHWTLLLAAVVADRFESDVILFEM